ncbi:hypothetical protein ZTR_02586 [Talaromyces verruculosus]|nr:hypothetical protein ZTR_02586 [Talaromyces verruculosus]
MAGFCRNFFALTTLRRPTTEVIFNAAQKAVELAMLGQIDEASAIFAILAQHNRSETVESGKENIRVWRPLFECDDGGFVTPSGEYKDKSFEEMLEDLNQNTLRFPEMWEDRGPERDDGDESTVPSTILREPATADEIARVESRLGCSLPDDLKNFYSLTNGTQAVISGPHLYTLRNSLLMVQELFWEDASWMVGYKFDLFPETTPPAQIK